MKHFNQAFSTICTESLQKREDLIASVATMDNSELISLEANLQIQLEALTTNLTQLDILEKQINYTDGLASTNSISKENLINTCNICNSIGGLMGISKESLINVSELESISLSNKAYQITKESIGEIAKTVKDKVVETIKKIIEWLKKIFNFKKQKETANKEEARKIEEQIKQQPKEQQAEKKEVSVEGIPALDYGYITIDELHNYGRLKSDWVKICDKVLNTDWIKASPDFADEIMHEIQNMTVKCFKNLGLRKKEAYFFVDSKHGYSFKKNGDASELDKELLQPQGEVKHVQLSALDAIALVDAVKNSPYVTEKLTEMDKKLEQLSKSNDSVDLHKVHCVKYYVKIINGLTDAAIDLDAAIVRVTKGFI